MGEVKRLFLPKYSKLYFERKKNLSSSIGVILLTFVFFVAALVWQLITSKGPAVMLGYLIVLVYVILVSYLLLFYKKIIEIKKNYGTSFSDEGIKRIGLHGVKETISYQIYEDAVKAGQYYYEKTGLVIGKGKNKLVFHYEIGNSSAQKDVISCYKKLEKNVSVLLPPFEEKCFDALDRQYFYKKSLKIQTISLIIGSLFLYVVARNITEMFAIGIIFVCPWECISLYILFKDAVMLAKNHTTIKEAFATYENSRIGSHYGGYLYFVTVLVVLIWLNTAIIF